MGGVKNLFKIPFQSDKCLESLSKQHLAQILLGPNRKM
jgi:hypothetical protein